jgi:hypothetical protein
VSDDEEDENVDDEKEIEMDELSTSSLRLKRFDAGDDEPSTSRSKRTGRPAARDAARKVKTYNLSDVEDDASPLFQTDTDDDDKSKVRSSALNS